MAIVDVSHELELATHMSAQEIRRELAVHLYALGKLSAGKARELANMDMVAFQCLLGSRGISVNYGLEDFKEDLETINRMVTDQ